jgi:hypothetical protein
MSAPLKFASPRRSTWFHFGGDGVFVHRLARLLRATGVDAALGRCHADAAGSAEELRDA